MEDLCTVFEVMRLMQIKKPKAVMFLALSLMFLLGLAVAMYRTALPTEMYYRRIIRDADQIELIAFLESNQETGIHLAIIKDAREKLLLADSVSICGLWMPLDELIGNSFCMRIIKGSSVDDIVLRGGSQIKYGRWFVSISPSTMQTFRRLVKEHGRTMPTLEELREEQGVGKITD